MQKNKFEGKTKDLAYNLPIEKKFSIRFTNYNPGVDINLPVRYGPNVWPWQRSTF
jgi:hypothetical protein